MPNFVLSPEQRRQPFHLHQLGATPGRDAQLPDRKHRLEVRVRVGIPQESDQGPQNTGPLARPVVGLEARDVVERKSDAPTSVQILRSVDRLQKKARNTPGFEQGLVVLGYHAEVAEA